jgi:hypothetical protein
MTSSNQEISNTQEKEREGLVFHLFGLGIPESRFHALWHQCSSQEDLFNVAMRVLFADYLRYRTVFVQPVFPFPPTFLNTDMVVYALHEQAAGLQVYLLCTCIDVLAGPDKFQSFESWLARRNNPDDGAIARILGTLSSNLDIHQAAAFRSVASKVYLEAYVPRYGDTRAFRRFFTQDTPPALRKFLGEVLFISPQLDQYPRFFPPATWDAEYSQWQSLDEEKRMRRVADYLYNQRRNPYTHNAKSNPPHPGTERVSGLSHHAAQTHQGNYPRWT